DIGHRDPQLAIVGFATAVDRHDVRVVQPGSDIGLTNEAGAKLLIPRQIRRKHLQRVAPRQGWILSEVHRAHAARAEHSVDSISGDNCSDGQHCSATSDARCHAWAIRSTIWPRIPTAWLPGLTL